MNRSVIYALLLTVIIPTVVRSECNIIEVNGSVEVVCVGTPTNTVNSNTVQSSSKIEVNNSYQQQEQVRIEKERCKLEEDSCSAGCSSKKYDAACFGGCRSTAARCKITALSMLPAETKSTCNERCKLEDEICSADCSSKKYDAACFGGCSSSLAQCKLQCL
jgi:hypothetical protein